MRKMKTGFMVLGLAGMLLFSGCGGASYDAAMEESAAESADMTSDYGMVEEASAEDIAEEAGEDTLGEGAGTAVSETVEQKLIYTENIDVETTEFDAFWTTINRKVESLGGYIEYSEISGQAERGDRYGNLTIRVPAEQLNQLVTEVDEKGTITYENKTTENVTLQYVDTESHLHALKVEEETLLSLLEKAEKLSDVFDIQARLTEVRYQIESCESRLRVMDNQVTYSTVNLSVREVARETVVAEKGFWSEAGTAFMDSLYSVKEAARSIALWFIGNLPVLVIYTVIILAVVLLLRRTGRKRKQKQQNEVQNIMKNTMGKEDNNDSV